MENTKGLLFKKVSVLLLVVTLFWASNLTAKFGIKGGLCLADLHLSHTEGFWKWETMKSFQVGAYFTINISDTFSLQPEFYYVVKGAKVNEPIIDISGATIELDMETKLGYIEIPILLKFTMPVYGKILPGIFTGPYVAFRISAEAAVNAPLVMDGQVIGEKEIEGALDEEEFRKLDFGLVVGGFIEIGLGRASHLVFDIRYTFGAIDVVCDADSKKWVKNQTIVFMTGIEF